MKLLGAIALFLAVLITLQFEALGWNIPDHMLSGAIAYQILRRETPTAISIVRSVLEKNPWDEAAGKSQLEKLPESERDEMLFMLAARGPTTSAPATLLKVIRSGTM